MRTIWSERHLFPLPVQEPSPPDQPVNHGPPCSHEAQERRKIGAGGGVGVSGKGDEAEWLAEDV